MFTALEWTTGAKVIVKPIAIRRPNDAYEMLLIADKTTGRGYGSTPMTANGISTCKALTAISCRRLKWLKMCTVRTKKSWRNGRTNCSPHMD